MSNDDSSRIPARTGHPKSPQANLRDVRLKLKPDEKKGNAITESVRRPSDEFPGIPRRRGW